MKSRIQCIVFDWDGTLMDSEAQIVSCLHAAIDDLQLAPMDDDTVKNVIGLGLKEAIDTLVPGRDERFHKAFVDFYREHWFKSGSSSLFEGVRETLEALKQQNLLLGVATGKARRGLERVLDETGLNGKPHPQMLLELMATLDVTPGQTVMVGDTEYDMEMATNAGAGKIAVRTGVHSEERLQRHAPLVCLDRIIDMQSWLEGHFASSPG